MTFGTLNRREAAEASGAFASAASAGSDGLTVSGRSTTGSRGCRAAVRRRVERGARHLAHEREDLRELCLVEGFVGRGEPKPCEGRDAGNREVLALGGHGRC